MSVYIITIIIVAVFCTCAEAGDYPCNDTLSWYTVQHTKTARGLYFVAVLTLVIVGGLRYNVGIDFWYYYLHGEDCANKLVTSIKSLYEPGINLLFYIIRKFSLDNALPIFVFSAFTTGLSLRVVFKNTDRLKMATLLYIFLLCWTGSFNAVKQCLACAIVLCGMPYLKNRNFIKYAIVVFIAFLFHRSAAIMILPYFVVHRKITPKNVCLLALGTCLIAFSYDRVFSFVSTLLEAEYSSTDSYIFGSVNIIRIFVAIAPVVFYLCTYRAEDYNQTTTFYINFCIINAALMIISANSPYLARSSMYITPFMAIGIPELNKPLKYRVRGIDSLMLVLYGAYFMYSVWGTTFEWTFA